MKKILFILGVILTFTLQAQDTIYNGIYPVVTSSSELITNTAESGGGSYTTQYQALLDEWETDPTGDTLTWQNAMVETLVDSGWWDKMEWLYVFATTNNGDNEALVNWIDPGGDYDMDDGDTIGWTRLQGVYGDLDDDYLNTGWNPTTVGRTGTDDCYGLYIHTLGTQFVDVYAGCMSGLNLLSVGANHSFRICNTTAVIASISNPGMFIASASNDTVNIFHNGSDVGRDVFISEFVPDTTWFFLGDVSNDYGGDGIIAIAFYSDSLRTYERVNITNVFETYMDNIGTGQIAYNYYPKRNDLFYATNLSKILYVKP